MMKMLNIKMRALILLLLFSMVPATMGSDGDKKLHIQGRKYIHDRQWEKAVETYGELLTSYPGSLFKDDARFWIGFAYEQIPGKEKEAFDRYQKLVDSVPASPWVDDAVIHQVLLAKKLTMKGG